MKNFFIGLLSFVAFISILFNLLFLRERQSMEGKGGWGNKGDLGGKGYLSKVTNVVDGDTFDIDDGNRIRLAEIDAPEFPKGCYSLQAKERLKNLILNKEVLIEVLKKDNFGRLLSWVFLNDLLINKALVSEGYANYSPLSQQTKYDVELLQAESEAKGAKRGIWSDLCQNTKTSDCLIKGNYRRDNKTKIYHLPNCYNYDKITIDERNGDRWFCSEEEATSAGFIKAQDCP